MSRLKGCIPVLILTAGVVFAAMGLVMQTFADAAGLYCFTVGVVLILIFIGIKTIQLNRE
jgi:hypothetical protein